MQKLRSHIAKTYVISLICAGLCLYLARPANAQQSTRAFSSWLSTMVDQQDHSMLEEELEQLSESGATVYKLMEHASIVMSKNGEKVDLPYSSAEASHRIYQVLLQQWNHFNTGNGMANMPPPEISKQLASYSVEKSGKVSFESASVGHVANSFISYSGLNQSPVHYSNSFEPMITGIAIGAP
ncbi:MAG: hypothetical protein R3222_02805 [Balneolaceae bacterium]|nr:hypothetical protein [Balneolaceae bacterium]